MKTGYIYKIIFKDRKIRDCYVGSTSIDPICRFRCHKYQSLIVSNRLYDFVRENGGIQNFIFKIIEKYDYNTLRELREREKFYVKLMKPSLNSNMPNRFYKEWRCDNKDRFNTYMKYYYKNKNQLKRELKYYNI